MQSDDAELAGLAAKIDREETYHRLHAELWAARLRDEPRFRSAVEELWPFALGVLEPELRPELAPARRPRAGGGDRARRRTCRSSRELWETMTEVRRSIPGRAMVTAEAVWAALDEIPDPEIPVISLVDLGVIRDVTVDGDRVRIEFTPTFLGCPALDAMTRRARDERRGARRGAGDRGDQDDSWSTDRISVCRPGEAARCGLRAACAPQRRADDARAAAVEGVPLPLLQLDRDAAREHLRPDAVPLDPLVRELPPAVRAVQDDLRLSTAAHPPWRCVDVPLRHPSVARCLPLGIASPIARPHPAQKTLPSTAASASSDFASGVQRVQTRGDQRLHRVRERAPRPLFRAASSSPCSLEQIAVLAAAGRTPRRTAGCLRRGRGSAAAAPPAALSSRAAPTRAERSLLRERSEVDRRRVAQPGARSRGAARTAPVEQSRPGAAARPRRGQPGARGRRAARRRPSAGPRTRAPPGRVLGDVLEEPPPGREQLLALRGRGRLDPEQRQAAAAGTTPAPPLRAAPRSSFSAATSGGSVSRIPACALTISPSAQKVIPSP